MIILLAVRLALALEEGLGADLLVADDAHEVLGMPDFAQRSGHLKKLAGASWMESVFALLVRGGPRTHILCQ